MTRILAALIATSLVGCAPDDEVYRIEVAQTHPSAAGAFHEHKLREGTALQIDVRAWTRETTFHDAREVTRPIKIHSTPESTLRVLPGEVSNVFFLFAGAPGEATLEITIDSVTRKEQLTVTKQ